MYIVAIPIDKPLAFLKDITPDNLDNVLRLRIFRLWSPPNYYNPLKPNCIEMVFVDEHVRLYHIMLYLFYTTNNTTILNQYNKKTFIQNRTPQSEVL